MTTNSSAAKDGGANQSKTTMPPVSQEYRENYTAIFGKSKLEKLAEQESKQNNFCNSHQESSYILDIESGKAISDID